MLTIGIDLAADNSNVGIAELKWEGRKLAHVDAYRLSDCLGKRQDGDEWLAERIIGWVKEQQAVVAVDVPFGWPTGYAQAVQRFAAGGGDDEPFPREEVTMQAKHIKFGERLPGSLLLRATDQFVRLVSRKNIRADLTSFWPKIEDPLQQGSLVRVVPLSPVVDRIAIPTLRWFRIWCRLQANDRWPNQPPSGPVQGARGVIEVYPAASRRLYGAVWENKWTSPGSWKAFCKALSVSEGVAPSPLAGAEGSVDKLLRSKIEHPASSSEHLRDAVLAALTGWQFAQGATISPEDVLGIEPFPAMLTGHEESEGALAQVQQEGWIHLPKGQR